MYSRCDDAKGRLFRIGMSLALGLSAGNLCAGKPPAAALPVVAASDVPVADAVQLALQEAGEARFSACALAIRRSFEVAPEVLALAAWPLDDSLPAECSNPETSAARAALAQPLPVVSTPSVPLAPAGRDAVVEAAGGGVAMTGAGASFATPGPFGRHAVSLDDTTLDGIRGGFELADSNLKLSFGIERAVFINGQLVASTVLNVRDLQLAAGSGHAQPATSAVVPGSVAVVQNGSAIMAQVGAGLAGTVVQNSLDNQKIQNVTTVNAVVNASQVLRGMSVQSAVHNGIVGSLRR